MATTTQTVYSGYATQILGSTTFERAGYELTEWRTSTASTGGQAYTPGSTYTFTANTSLYAQWTYKPIQIMYGSRYGYANDVAYKFTPAATLAVVNSASTVLSPYADAGLTDPERIHACDDLGSGYVTSVSDYGLCSTHISRCTLPACVTIGFRAFYWCWYLESISFPKCQTIGSAAFYYDVGIKVASFPACTTIGQSAFCFCSGMTTASFPECTSCGTTAFYSCTSLTTVYFPKLSVSAAIFDESPVVTATVGNSGTLANIFSAAKSTLKSITLPSCKTIGTAFTGYTALETVSAPVCTTVKGLSSCTALKTASFPACTAVGSGALNDCTALETLYMPNCTNKEGAFAVDSPLKFVTLGTDTVVKFSSAMSTLLSVNYPNATTLGGNLMKFTALVVASLPACTEIAGGGFSGCTSLVNAYLPVCTSVADASSSRNAAFYGCSSLNCTLGIPALYSETFSGATLKTL